jgi:hypothetical protein
MAEDERFQVRDTYANGDEYEGEVRVEPTASGRRVLKHGHGVYRFAKGSSYDGEWADGKMHGWGVFQEADSRDRYEGHWQGGKRTIGLYFYGTGDIYQGCFHNNQKHGRGVAWEDRQMFEVVYDHDVLVSKTPFVTTPSARQHHEQTTAATAAPTARVQKPRAPRGAASQFGRSMPPEAVLLRPSFRPGGAVPSSRTITAAQYSVAMRVVKQGVRRREAAQRNEAIADALPPRSKSATIAPPKADDRGLEFEREDRLRDLYRYY